MKADPQPQAVLARCRRGLLASPWTVRTSALALLAVSTTTLADEGQLTASDCPQAQTPTEQAICNDPALRARDRTLVDAWASARRHTRYRDALLADQRAWLRRRDADCGNDVACLHRSYTMRIAALQATAGSFKWEGHWERLGGPGTHADLRINATPDGALHVEFEASNGGNMGQFDADAKVSGDRLVLRHNDCTLTLQRVHNQLEVGQDGSDAGCGAGAGVYFDGRYVPSGSEQPDWNLLAMGVVKTPARDNQVRMLLGSDGYQALLDRANQVSKDDAVPGLTTFGVRGLYTSMEGALQQDGDAIRVGLLQDDEVRWYSNDPATRAEPPAWFDKWRERFAGKPVRLMSVQGQPLLQRAANGD